MAEVQSINSSANASSTNSRRDSQQADAGGQEFLVFTLGAEEYGIDILKVQEIRGYDNVTRIANAPEFIKGVINLRGIIVPIVDMRIKYVRPINPTQTIRVTATLIEYENRLKTNYVITDAATDEVLTKAHTIQVTVDRASQELCFETPPALVEKVRRWL